MSYYDYHVLGVPKVIDGDTYDLDVDLGFHAKMRIRVRLKDIDTYEVYGTNAHPKGTLARAHAATWLATHLDDGILAVRTFKLNATTPVSDGAFGRWLGEVYETESGTLLADSLRAAGFAEDA